MGFLFESSTRYLTKERSTITFKLFMIWRPFFARGKVNHGRLNSRILVKVCAVAMATGLVKNKA